MDSTIDPAERGFTATATAPADRPGVAIVANAITPYRVHLHRRIAREIGGIRLWTVFTHEESNSPWRFDPPPEIGAVSFGRGESALGQSAARNALREWRKGGRIVRWLRENRIAAVVVLGYSDPGRLRILAWCRRNGIPCFLFGDSNIRGDRATGWRRALKRAVLTRIVRSCSGVLACGMLGRDYFRRYGADPARIHLFPYEPDYDLVRGLSPAVLAAAAERFGLAPARRRIVFSGRLVPVKRPDLLLDAFLEIENERPDWDLLVVGDGPLGAGLRQRVPERLRQRVCFTGFVDGQETVAALYRLSDVLVLPSDAEPWALVVNEAAAAGLAIVASDVVGAAAELVRDGVNGFVFRAGDGADLTRRLREATLPGRIDEMKRASAGVLDEWRRRADPVDGLRAALRSCGLLPPA